MGRYDSIRTPITITFAEAYPDLTDIEIETLASEFIPLRKAVGAVTFDIVCGRAINNQDVYDIIKKRVNGVPCANDTCSSIIVWYMTVPELLEFKTLSNFMKIHNIIMKPRKVYLTKNAEKKASELLTV